MKNLRISLMLFLGILASGSVMAKGVVKVDGVPGENDKAVVNVLNAPDHEVQVELKDNNGDILYIDNDEVPTYDFKEVYDLSGLKNGKYTLEATLGNETEKDNVVVKNGDVQIVNQNEEIAPSFSLDGKYLDFSFANSALKDAQFLIYNKDSNHWIYQESLNNEFDIQQSLNLSRLKSGDYKAMLISGNDAYDFDFHI